MISTILTFADKWRQVLFAISLIPLGLASVYRMYVEFYRLLFADDAAAAIDLHQRYVEIISWFAGEPTYHDFYTAVYPPASYLLLRPFIHYESFMTVRWIWAITTVIALVVLIAVLIRESKAKTIVERLFMAFLVLGIYSTGPVIGNGQLTIHVMAALALGLTLVRESPPHLGRVLAGGALVVFALMKPTLAAPFFLIFVFTPKRFRVAVAVGSMYAVVALIATTYQEGNVITSHREWLTRGLEGARWGSSGGGAGEAQGWTHTEQWEQEHDVEHHEEHTEVPPESAAENPPEVHSEKSHGLQKGVGTGFGSVHDWLGWRGFSEWNMKASLFVLFLLSVWILLHRSIDIWVLFGTVAIVSRFWAYHLFYDDMLLLLSAVALFRIGANSSLGDKTRLTSLALLGIYTVAALAPATMRLMPDPVGITFKTIQGAIWFAILALLIVHAWTLRANVAESDKPRSDTV